MLRRQGSILQAASGHDSPRSESARKNGREVLEEIKADDILKRIPVIVMTTSKAEQDIHRVYNLNANCYVTKPVDLDEFLNVVVQLRTSG